jgi:hypothetical protein
MIRITRNVALFNLALSLALWAVCVGAVASASPLGTVPAISFWTADGVLSCNDALIRGKLRGTNPKPLVIPTLQEWLGGEGKIEISKASDILIEPQYENDARVKEIASQLTEEISGYPATTSLLRGHPCLIGTRKLNSRKMSAAG